MKTPFRHGVILLLSVTLATHSVAGVLNSQTDPDVNPHALQDADGVPLSVTQQRPVTPADSGPTQAQIEKAQQDHDWLMRSYEQQLQAHSQNGGSDVYSQIVSDKTLAKIAGVPYVEKSTPQDVTTFKTGTPVTGNAPVTLRADSSPANAKPHVTQAFKPLITPLGATAAAGLPNFYAISPSAAFLPAEAPAAPSPPPSPSEPLDNSAMDMPGQTAAEHDPMNKNAGLVFDLGMNDDQLPQKQHDGNTGDLPMSTNLEQIHKLDEAALNVPGVSPKALPVKPINPVMIPIPEDLMPAKLTSPSPIHAPIADPRDIFH